MIAKISNTIKNRVAAYRADESGMEAAQVILILAIVVVVLLPVIMLIVNALKNQGTAVTNGINGVN